MADMYNESGDISKVEECNDNNTFSYQFNNQ